MLSLTYNVHGWVSWPKRVFEDMDFDKIEKMFSKALAKYRPNIITLSEASLSPVLDAVLQNLEMNYVVFPSSRSWPGVLLTKHKVLEAAGCSFDRKYWSRKLFTRHWGRVLLDTELGDVAVHSLHLYPDPSSEGEVSEVLKVLRNDMNLGYSIIVQGDLNHEPKDYAYRLWMDAGLVDAFVKVGVGKGGTFRANEPSRRIDYVLVYGPIADNLVECRVLNEPPFKFNEINGEEYALSDHLPVMATFS